MPSFMDFVGTLGQKGDPEARSGDGSIAGLLKGLRALTSRGVAADGNPYVQTHDLPTANTPVTVNLNATLGRNAHYGFIRSKSGNAGVVQVAFSFNGSTFTNYMEELRPGATMTLDHLDVHSLRLMSSGLGDDVIVVAH